MCDCCTTCRVNICLRMCDVKLLNNMALLLTVPIFIVKQIFGGNFESIWYIALVPPRFPRSLDNRRLIYKYFLYLCIVLLYSLLQPVIAPADIIFFGYLLITAFFTSFFLPASHSSPLFGLLRLLLFKTKNKYSTDGSGLSNTALTI